MVRSKNIAQLLGPALIVLNLSEILNAHIWSAVTPTQTYLAGALWFVAGLSIIRAHNLWTRSWPVLITIMGWFIMLGGMSRMFFPEAVQEGAQNPSAVLITQMVLIAIGIVLSFNAFSRDNPRPLNS